MTRLLQVLQIFPLQNGEKEYKNLEENKVKAKLLEETKDEDL